ncbi:MAG: polyprenyl synthetase family protein [bacterium]
MSGIETLQQSFEAYFSHRHFPNFPSTLYDPLEEFLSNSGKRIRPVLCLMGNELFSDIHQDAYHAAAAVELFHNFTLIHDDIMDKAPLRRGKATVHSVHGEPTALLGGDVMMVVSYDYINKIESPQIKAIISLFNKTAKEVCEGQQLDMDFEKREIVSLDEYLNMIEMKTSVLLASSLQMGAIIGGADHSDQQNLYEFGRNLGVAFQIQDDYLDAFGDPSKFGKQVGGDIQSNKKTFLLIHALETTTGSMADLLKSVIKHNPENKVETVLEIYRSCGIDKWANQLKDDFLSKAFEQLDAIKVPEIRKEPLRSLAKYLISRDK